MSSQPKPPQSNSPLLEIRDATVWRGEQADRIALDGLSLTLRVGESVAILGPNGAGKSTLLKILTGELRPEWKEGMICRVFGEDEWEIDALRSRIGVVMPDHVGRIDPAESGRNVVLCSFRGAFGRAPWMRFSKVEKQSANDALDKVGVSHLAERSFREMSSGEQRRVMVARALAHDPAVLVLDEPSTALDFAASLQMAASLRGLLQSGHTLVWSTHHPGEIPPEVGRVMLLKHGRLFADGPKRKVLTPAILSELYGVPLTVSWLRGWCSVR
jgi:iron complex transport system ATP-binding protein